MLVDELMALNKNALIAYDGRTGQKLFDTRINKKEYIQIFNKGEVIAIWSDIVHVGVGNFDPYIKPVTKCYISHNSWYANEDNE